MSAILSADSLNDYISPGVACIKPVENLPQQKPTSLDDAYEVTTEDKLPQEAPTAQISLTDCLACSGCVTSAEAVLVSLQSHAEVLTSLDSCKAFSSDDIRSLGDRAELTNNGTLERKLFVASVSPQVRASLAVTYGTSEKEAGYMIDQLLCGPRGLATGGTIGNSFAWTVDTNMMREVCLTMGAEEVLNPSINQLTQTPVLASACPGWVCYAEKTHPHVLPHLSKIKSPQALTGILLKTVLSAKLKINPEQIFHLAVMPCFDKKLEGSRQELTNKYWNEPNQEDLAPAVRDVDCVITAREILMLAETRGISFPALPRVALKLSDRPEFPDKIVGSLLFASSAGQNIKQHPDAGTSGGYLYHILQEKQKQHSGSTIQIQRGRNPDIIDYNLIVNNEVIFRTARYYGFRNIQNLVRKLRPAKISKISGKAIGSRKPATNGPGIPEYSYVEVMACPGGCTNGGGQIKLDDLGVLQGKLTNVRNQKEWLGLVDEAYYSMEEEDTPISDAADATKSQDALGIKEFLRHWSTTTNIPQEKLLWTSFREVVSDVGKPKKLDTERVAEIATKLGGGW